MLVALFLAVIGDLVQQGVTQNDESVTGAATVIVTLALLTVVTAYIGYRVRALRPVLEGEPVVLIANGQVLDSSLRRQRITRQEIEAEARLASIGSFSDIRFAVLETNGRISFLSASDGSGRGDPQGDEPTLA